MHRVKCFAVLLLPVLSSGCLTAKVVDAIEDAGGGGHQPTRSYRVHAKQVVEAVQTADGKFHLSARYSDGSLQHLVFTPWPRARRRGARPQRVPQLKRVATPLPEGASVSVSDDWRRAPGGMCFARNGGKLLLRRRNRAFLPVASFPQLMRKEHARRAGSLGRQIALGFILPLAVIGDAILVGGYAGAIFVSAGGLAAFVK